MNETATTQSAKEIEGLHAWFCERTRLKTKLCFSERIWFDRLRDYEYDAGKLKTDCDLIVRYLQREIAAGSRNVGALKLGNFLQPDTFDSDLALAKLAAGRVRAKEQGPRNPEPIGPMLRLRKEEIARKLKEFRLHLAETPSEQIDEGIGHE